MRYRIEFEGEYFGPRKNTAFKHLFLGYYLRIYVHDFKSSTRFCVRYQEQGGAMSVAQRAFFGTVFVKSSIKKYGRLLEVCTHN